ncbi:hypothetical protein TKK_0018949 [Trichogramma kaykai]
MPNTLIRDPGKKLNTVKADWIRMPGVDSTGYSVAPILASFPAEASPALDSSYCSGNPGNANTLGKGLSCGSAFSEASSNSSSWALFLLDRQEFQFDKVYDGTTNHSQLHELELKPIINKLKGEENAAMMVYGQSGSGIWKEIENVKYVKIEFIQLIGKCPIKDIIGNKTDYVTVLKDSTLRNAESKKNMFSKLKLFMESYKNKINVDIRTTRVLVASCS